MTIDYAKLGAIELQQEIDRAEGDFKKALQEIDRLRLVLIGIVDIINTDNRLIVESQLDPWAVLEDIEDMAQRYYLG